MFDDTSYFVTVGLSNTVQLRLLGKYSVMLELLESLLCCPTRHSFFFLVLLLSCSPSSFLLLSFFGCNKDVFQPPCVKPYGTRPIPREGAVAPNAQAQ